MTHEQTILFLEANPLAEAVLTNHFQSARGLLKSYFPKLTEKQVDGIISWWMTNRRKIKTTKVPKAKK